MAAKKSNKAPAKQQKVVTSSVAAAKGTKVKTTVPKVAYQPNGVCLVKHTEYVADVDAGIGPSLQTLKFAVNPQRNATFTWLSALATRFEMYRFRKLKFMYKPSCGTNTGGFIVLGFDFDFYDAAPGKAAVLAWKYSSKTATWQDNRLDVSPDARLATARYCNYGVEQGDARLDMLGNIFVLAQSDATTIVGELFVEYEVELIQPSYKIPSSLYARIQTPSDRSLSDLFNEPVTILGNMLIDKIAGTANFMIRDVGQYLVELVVQADAGMITTPTITMSSPPENPSAQWEIASKDQFYTGTGNGSFHTYLLNVLSAPVVMHPYISSGVGPMEGRLRIATYDNSLK